jgi:hypothetical protein
MAESEEEKLLRRINKRCGVGSGETAAQVVDRLIKSERRRLGLRGNSPDPMHPSPTARVHACPDSHAEPG